MLSGEQKSDEFYGDHVLQLRRYIKELDSMFPIQISEAVSSEVAAVRRNEKTFVIQCCENKKSKLDIDEGAITLDTTRRVWDAASSLIDWFGDIQDPENLRSALTFMFVFDVRDDVKQLLAMNLMAQIILGAYFVEGVIVRPPVPTCVLHMLDTCFKRSVTLQSPTPYGNDLLLLNSHAFEHNDEHVPTNDDNFIETIASKVVRFEYSSDRFFSNDVIVSPVLDEPFPIGTTWADFKQPVTNPPVLRPRTEPAAPAQVVDAGLREKVGQQLNYVQRGLLPLQDVQPLLSELNRQEIAAGVAPTRTASLGGRRSGTPRRRRRTVRTQVRPSPVPRRRPKSRARRSRK